MRTRRSSTTNSRNGERNNSTESSALERKRQYKREFMRRWRANPHHRLRESLLRTQWTYERKKRDAARPSTHTNARGELKCGICGKLPPVTEVVRLRVSEAAPDGYVEVRIPYCGTC
jgi:hypothetical protein